MTEPLFPTVEVSDPELEVEGLRYATVFSRALDRRADCTFWAPEAHDVPLPLVVLLHGVYGSHWAWAAKGGAHHAAERLVRSGTIPPVALAMPSDGLFGHGSGYLDHPGGAFERWIVDEVPALATQVLPQVAGDLPFAVVGLSMGGFGALSIGARHGDRVAAMVGLSSITDFVQMKLFVGRLDGYDVDPGHRSVLDAILENRDRLPAIRFDCGVDDLLIEPNRKLHRDLTTHGIEHDWREHTGGHDWDYWRAHLPDALTFGSSHLGTTGPVAPPASPSPSSPSPLLARPDRRGRS